MELLGCNSVLMGRKKSTQVSERGVQSTRHALHAWTPDPRRSQFCNCPPHSAALCAALSVSASLLTMLKKRQSCQPRNGDGVAQRTYREWRRPSETLGGNDEPIWVFPTRSREVMFCRVSGSGPSTVFSRCREVSFVKAPNGPGNAPAMESS